MPSPCPRDLRLTALDPVLLPSEILDLVPGLLVAAQMLRTDRHLAVAAGDVQHVGRLAEPGIAAAQRAHQRLAARDAGAPMRRPGRQIAVVQVVRLDAAL